MSSEYDDFINRYSVRNIQLNNDHSYRKFDYYNRTASYYDPRDETVDIELHRSAFDQLVRLDRRFDDLTMEYRDEAYMRSKHPALKDAYDKYRMLLELYR